MLSEVESLRVQSLWLLKKALPSREEPDISLSILSKRFMCVLLARSAVACSIHVAMILHILNV